MLLWRRITHFLATPKGKMTMFLFPTLISWKLMGTVISVSILGLCYILVFQYLCADTAWYNSGTKGYLEKRHYLARMDTQCRVLISLGLAGVFNGILIHIMHTRLLGILVVVLNVSLTLVGYVILHTIHQKYPQ